MAKKLEAFQNHLSSSEGLITPHEETRAGFLSFALEKNSRAIPFIEEARALRITASEATIPSDLLKISSIQTALLTSAGLSKKSQKHLKLVEKQGLLDEWIKNVLEPEGQKFVDELVFRYLLTKGDELGGIMRNVTGKIGERKFSLALLSALRIRNINYTWFSSLSKTWIASRKSDNGIETSLTGLFWKDKRKNRTALYNRKIAIVDKNIDFVLLDCNFDDYSTAITSPERFIALGELKCGIDPAGADEHWKTANSALERVRNAFLNIKITPKLFFVGAAIENSMAAEIFNQLNQEKLANAANLTNANQLTSLCNWLVEM